MLSEPTRCTGPGLSAVLRPANPDDEPFLRTLFCDVRAPEFTGLGLPEPALEQLLEMQWRAQRSGYAAQYSNALDHIILLDSAPAGRLLLDVQPTSLHLVDLALLASVRGQGLGTAVMLKLVEEADRRCLPIDLHVRVGNPALHLYQRLGFVQAATDGLNDQLRREPASTGRIGSGSESSAFFRSLLGQTLQATAPNGTVVELCLSAVDMLKPFTPAEQSDSFSLKFTGPLDPVLPGSTVPMRTESGLAIEIFLVPVAREPEAILYESVFNRGGVSPEIGRSPGSHKSNRAEVPQ